MPYKNKICGIYMLTCRPIGKRYIGQSVNVNRRWIEHRRRRSSTLAISSAIKKYGWENFNKRKSSRNVRKKNLTSVKFIILRNNTGYKHSPKTKELFKKSIICIETGEIFESVNSAAAKISVNHSSISQVLNGKTKTAGGYHWEYLHEEDKQNRGNHFSKDVIEHFRKINLGRKVSAETAAKISEKLKNRSGESWQKTVMCVETGEIFQSVKIAAAHVGVHQSHLSKVLHGRKKTAGGYHWKFVKEKDT